jgi:hypothetical protein
MITTLEKITIALPEKYKAVQKQIQEWNEKFLSKTGRGRC